MKTLRFHEHGRFQARPSGLITVALIVVSLGLISATALGQEGVFEYVEGNVIVFSGSIEFDADFGTQVKPGDRVRTGAGATAVIRLNDRSQVKLRENTDLRMDSLGEEAAVTLSNGGVFARVASSAAGVARRIAGFEVHTPSVVAGVRGTEFFVAYGRTIEDQPDLWLCVNEGTVEVEVPSTGQTTLVEEGEGINILGGLRATRPRFYPWTQDLNWNFNPSAGQITDDTDLDGAYADLLDQDYD